MSLPDASQKALVLVSSAGRFVSFVEVVGSQRPITQLTPNNPTPSVYASVTGNQRGADANRVRIVDSHDQSWVGASRVWRVSEAHLDFRGSS